MEQWKIIPAFPDYSISNEGRVRRDVTIPPNGESGCRGKYPGLIKLGKGGAGYMKVNLYMTGWKGSFTRFVHKLVAKAFIPNPENKPTVNHEDGNKKNNKVGNLTWATRREQFEHALKLGLLLRDSSTGCLKKSQKGIFNG